MSYFYYIVNLAGDGVLTVVSGFPPSLVVQPKIKPRSHYQLWYMDDPAHSTIRLYKSDFVLQKSTTGPPGGYWVTMAVSTDNKSQLWSYNHENSWIRNVGSDCMLAVWGTNAVMCGPPIGSQRDSQSGEAAGVEMEGAKFYAWQLQIAGSDDEEA
jgi:hypothetical protein